MATRLFIKRIYEPATATDGYRVLVDRIWPRGLSKDKAKVDLWLKEIAPSTRLRQWFGHAPEKWPEFQKRYQTELHANPVALQRLYAVLHEHNPVTLLFGARETTYNNAAALGAFLVQAGEKSNRSG